MLGDQLGNWEQFIIFPIGIMRIITEYEWFLWFSYNPINGVEVYSLFYISPDVNILSIPFIHTHSYITSRTGYWNNRRTSQSFKQKFSFSKMVWFNTNEQVTFRPFNADYNSKDGKTVIILMLTFLKDDTYLNTSFGSKIWFWILVTEGPRPLCKHHHTWSQTHRRS